MNLDNLILDKNVNIYENDDHLFMKYRQGLIKQRFNTYFVLRFGSANVTNNHLRLCVWDIFNLKSF